jgi:hypothetical protein
VPIAGGTITIDEDGTLALADDNDTIPGTAGTGDIVNNGTILTEVTAIANLKGILTVPSGSGTVESTGVLVATLDTDTVTLSQNLLISDGSVIAPTPTGSDPVFGGGKTITIEGSGVLIFPGAVNITTNAIGATIGYDEDAPGTVRTLTTSSERLADFFALGGNIDAGGAVATLTAALTVPEDVILTTGGGGNYAGAFAVTVNGEATFGAATFGTVTTLTVGPNGNVTFSGTVAAVVIEINGVARFANAIATPVTSVTVGANGDATFVSLTPTTALTINGTARVPLTGTVTFPDDATIAGDLILGASAILAGGTYDLNVTGTVTLGSTAATATTGSGKISGTGAIKVSGLNDISFKLAGTGVDVGDLDTETGSLATDLAKGTAIPLDAAFRKAGTIGVSALGSLTAPDNSTATAVTNGGAGTGTSIALASGTAATGGTIKLDKYSKTVVNVSQITIEQDGVNLKVTDAGWAGATDTFAILAVEGLKLSRGTTNGIEVDVPTFNIGLKTKRS